ncbi:hypothetical protein [Rhodococcus aetherivorans]|uniref:hypothetical protein n=1 Tax=Rhodococcus TaxID=1827 RepID=UPI00045D0929|nr:hypothetical protein [Rhodococcus aetherivorans]KDE14229.1 hypothetical protein N505_0105250 [Rhodococcus aetherivorans]
MTNTMFICGGDYAKLAPRDSCLNALHDWPLPLGYVDAAEVASSRLSHGWQNVKCRECGLYGWIPGQFNGAAANSRKVIADA